MNSSRIHPLFRAKNLHRLVLVSAAALALSTLTSCGCSSSPTTSTTAIIGAAGGTLTGPDGVQVVIPAGALTQDTTISIARSSAGAPAALEAYPVAGNVYEFTPHDVIFNSLITIRAPVPSGSTGTDVFMASPGGNWKRLDALVANGVGEWQRNSFSYGFYGTGVCFIPTAMLNDPYWCVNDRSSAHVTATPAQAMTQTSVSSVQNGDAGSYYVNQPATLQMTSFFEVAGNCSNVVVNLTRIQMDPVTVKWSPLQIVATQNPALVVDGGKLKGTATFPFVANHSENGKSRFGIYVHFDCPKVAHAPNSSTITGWDSYNHSSSEVHDGMLVDINIAQPTVFFTVGVSVSGLSGVGGLVLQNNGTDFTSQINSDGNFTFATSAASGTPYDVTVLTQPAGQFCTVTNGSGTANANVTNVAVNCVNNYSIGGTISGLVGTGLVLRNNAGNDLPVSANGAFAFSSPVAAGTTYAVTVLAQPTGQSCTVQGGSGTASANVSDVAVTCIAGMAWQGATLIETGSGDFPIVPSIAMDPTGNAFAIWVQNGSGFYPDIWTNRYVAGTGWETGTLMEVSDTNVGIPSIAIQDNGNAMAVWPQTNGIRDNIWASRYVVGSGWSTPVLIETNTAGNAYAPNVAIDANGDAIAVWHKYDGTRNNIWANRFVPGTGWGAATLIETNNTQSASYPRIAMNANGDAIAVWDQYDGARNNIWANRYVVGTGTWGAAELIETDNAGSAVSPSIAVDVNGNAIAVWVQSDGTRFNLWTNRYVAGTGWGIAALIEYDNAGDVYQDSPVVMDANGNAMVVWSQFDGIRSNVWANRYIAGTGWGSATLIENNVGYTASPSIAMNASGNAIAVWHQSDGTRTNIWANRFVAGTGWGTASLIETDDIGDAIYPSVVMSTNGNAIATWLQWDGTRNNLLANVFK